MPVCIMCFEFIEQISILFLIIQVQESKCKIPVMCLLEYLPVTIFFLSSQSHKIVNATYGLPLFRLSLSVSPEWSGFSGLIKSYHCNRVSEDRILHRHLVSGVKQIDGRQTTQRWLAGKITYNNHQHHETTAIFFHMPHVTWNPVCIMAYTPVTICARTR